MPCTHRPGTSPSAGLVVEDLFTVLALVLLPALLGATPEQIDRERDRTHTELFGRAESDTGA